jgi:hypothetical protein
MFSAHIASTTWSQVTNPRSRLTRSSASKPGRANRIQVLSDRSAEHEHQRHLTIAERLEVSRRALAFDDGVVATPNLDEQLTSQQCRLDRSSGRFLDDDAKDESRRGGAPRRSRNGGVTLALLRARRGCIAAANRLTAGSNRLLN